VALLLAMFLPAPLPAQQPGQGQTNPTETAQTTVHGIVRNAATGEPLPRALVRIEGDAAAGSLTDGEGRFEIPDVPLGPQAFQVLKPGFRDRPYAAAAAVMDNEVSPDHNVLVAAEMPDVLFALAPTGSIHGQISLSTGDPAQGIGVQLIRRVVQDGRALWQMASSTKTNSSGTFRFAGLTDGTYAIYTEPAMESEPATTLTENGSAVERAGYASVFYPDARDLAGAAKIRLASGEHAQANFALTLEPFHTVTATAALLHGRSSTEAAAEKNLTAMVLDAAGHQLPYAAQSDPATNSIQTMLPDGSYTLLAGSLQPGPEASSPSQKDFSLMENLRVLAGSVDVSVSGHAVPNLRISLAPPPSNPVHLTLTQTATHSAPTQGAHGTIEVLASQTGGWISDGLTTLYAQDMKPGPNPVAYLPPGTYWVRAATSASGFCEQSFTAGGTSLAREPAVIGLSNSPAPMELTLRDDCAKLTISLPQTVAAMLPGEEPFYTVYVVPDFDSTVDVTPLTLRPSTGGTLTLENLTPGSYHVYTFSAPVRLEYRNPAALAALSTPGQTVTLSPDVTSNLVLEIPSR
jgi:hypothetical protein